jgi:hypothetical protein
MSKPITFEVCSDLHSTVELAKDLASVGVLIAAVDVVWVLNSGFSELTNDVLAIGFSIIAAGFSIYLYAKRKMKKCVK